MEQLALVQHLEEALNQSDATSAFDYLQQLKNMSVNVQVMLVLTPLDLESDATSSIQADGYVQNSSYRSSQEEEDYVGPRQPGSTKVQAVGAFESIRSQKPGIPPVRDFDTR